MDYTVAKIFPNRFTFYIAMDFFPFFKLPGLDTITYEVDTLFFTLTFHWELALPVSTYLTLLDVITFQGSQDKVHHVEVLLTIINLTEMGIMLINDAYQMAGERENVG